MTQELCLQQKSLQLLPIQLSQINQIHCFFLFSPNLEFYYLLELRSQGLLVTFDLLRKKGSLAMKLLNYRSDTLRVISCIFSLLPSFWLFTIWQKLCDLCLLAKVNQRKFSSQIQIYWSPFRAFMFYCCILHDLAESRGCLVDPLSSFH